MPHLAGGKITATHSTVIDAAVIIVKFAVKEPSITKIGLGKISQMRSTSKGRRLIITEQPAGLLVKVRGSNSLQEIRLYTKDHAKIIGALERFQN